MNNADNQNIEHLPHGVIVGTIPQIMQQSIESTPDAIPMRLSKGKRIKEHTHGNSMYFTKNVRAVTIDNKEYELPANTAWAFIPEGVSHGWADVRSQGIGTIHSYHPDHTHSVLLRT